MAKDIILSKIFELNKNWLKIAVWPGNAPIGGGYELTRTHSRSFNTFMNIYSKLACVISTTDWNYKYFCKFMASWSTTISYWMLNFVKHYFDYDSILDHPTSNSNDEVTKTFLLIWWLFNLFFVMPFWVGGLV